MINEETTDKTENSGGDVVIQLAECLLITLRNSMQKRLLRDALHIGRVVLTGFTDAGHESKHAKHSPLSCATRMHHTRLP